MLLSFHIIRADSMAADWYLKCSTLSHTKIDARTDLMIQRNEWTENAVFSAIIYKYRYCFAMHLNGRYNFMCAEDYEIWILYYFSIDTPAHPINPNVNIYIFEAQSTIQDQYLFA